MPSAIKHDVGPSGKLLGRHLEKPTFEGGTSVASVTDWCYQTQALAVEPTASSPATCSDHHQPQADWERMDSSSMGELGTTDPEQWIVTQRCRVALLLGIVELAKCLGRQTGAADSNSV